MEDLKNNKSYNILLWFFIIVSIIHVIYASFTMRGMYEDGVFWMLDLLNNFANNRYAFSYDSEHPRFFCVWLTQLPLLIVNFIFALKSKFAYMIIYSFTQFSFPLLALWWNYKLAKRTDRIDIFFWSLFNYCAVITLFMIFSVVELIIGTVLHFILWNYLAAKMDYKKSDIILILFLLFMMFMTYEHVVILGIIFFIASFQYVLEETSLKRQGVKTLIGFGALSASLYDIFFMAQVKGEGGEIVRFFKEWIDFIPHILELNSLFTITALVSFIIVLFMKKNLSIKWIVFFIIINIGVLLNLYSNPQLSVYPMWEQHFRSIPCWMLPLIFIILLVSDLIKKEKNSVLFSNLICVTLICGIMQTIWQINNTFYWNENIQYMKRELAASSELLYNPIEHEEMSGFHNPQLRRYIWHGVFAATSILFSDTYEQKTLLMNYDEQQDPGNGNYRSRLYVVPYRENRMSIPYGVYISIKNKYWDLTKCAEALDKYNKENNIYTEE